MHRIRVALAFDRASAGKSIPARMAMIAITTRSSIKVKADWAWRLIPSPEYFTTGDIAWEVQELDLIDRLDVGFITELPDDGFRRRDFEDLRLLSEVTVAEIIAEDGVAIAGRRLRVDLRGP